jgi:general secretion pathway protein B
LGKNLESDTNISISKNREAQSQGQKEDLSQYRILGKPINEELSSLTETESTPVANNSSFEAPKKLDSESENNEAAIRLKAAFDLAVAETADKDFSQKESEQETADNDSERLQIEFLPTKTQSEIGQITYQAHIYATSEHKRWIKINGIELYEGDKIKGMRLLEITPDTSVFRFQGYDFEVKAMQNWQHN